MLLREDEHGVLAIGQQSHAWLAGQLARAWGNERFGRFDPWEEVCLAAEQHDVGWAPVDLEPLIDPDRGLPRSFMDMPLDVHLDLWAQGPRALLTQSAYAALLCSMHGRRLYERRDLERAPPAEADAIREFLAGQRTFQQQLIDELGADRQELERNSLLIWTWDYLSLAVCLGWDPATAQGCPAADGRVDIHVTGSGAGGAITIDPWPFAEGSLRVRCEGRRLVGRFSSQPELRDALDRAAPETLELELAAR
jgi:hypothetical protein